MEGPGCPRPVPRWGCFRPVEFIRTNRLKATGLCRRHIAKGACLIHGDIGHGIASKTELSQPDGLPAASSMAHGEVHQACPVGPDHGRGWCCRVSSPRGIFKVVIVFPLHHPVHVMAPGPDGAAVHCPEIKASGLEVLCAPRPASPQILWAWEDGVCGI